MAIYSAVACLFFLVLYIISSYINTVNTLNSTGHLAQFASYVFVFFLSASFAIKKRYLFLFLVIFSLGSITLYTFHSLQILPIPFVTDHDFQFILPTASGHNHLGDLVGLGLISSLFLTVSPLVVIIQTIFLIVIGTSFSKSAIVALVFTVFFLTFQKRRYLALFIGLTLIAGILIGIYSKEPIPLAPLGRAQKTIQTALHINPKPILSSRERYIGQIFKPWAAPQLEHLFFGYGPGNFRYASNRTAKSTWDVVTDTHTIVLTFFVESGILPLIWFIAFVGITIYLGYKNKNPLVYLLFYLFVHFQMDYAYRIPFFMYLFFFLSGQIAYIPGKQSSSLWYRRILFFVSLSAVIVTVIVNRVAIQRYEAQNILLNKAIQTRDKKTFATSANELERMTPYDTDLLITLSSFNESFGNTGESARLLDKLYVYAPRDYFANLPHLMALLKKMKRDTKSYLEAKENEFMTFPFTEKEKSFLDHTCREYLERECL